MIYGSVCSGIEAATVAWEPLGWRPSFFSEIEAFPRAVLNHHYPQVPLHGDFTTIEAGSYEPIELLVGGTPCQSFSVAGKRLGLDDPRGNLAIEYCRLARRLRPQWLLWENVPGVLSANGGRDFGAFLGLLGECGYGWAYRVLDAQYVRVDGYARAVPQRRRRVFLVGYLGDWRRAAAVLFEPHGMRWDRPPRREAGQGIAPTISARPTGGGGLGTDFDLDGGLIASDVAATLPAGGNSTGGNRQPGTSAETAATMLVAHPVAFDMRGREGGSQFEGPHETANIRAASGGSSRSYVTHAIQAGALRENPASGPDGVGVQESIAYTLEARAEVQAVQHEWAVRRLTPRECERLQGFRDGYTDVPWRRKNWTPDGPRYKALGNSMAVNVMRWIGRRIEQARIATKT